MQKNTLYANLKIKKNVPIIKKIFNSNFQLKMRTWS